MKRLLAGVAMVCSCTCAIADETPVPTPPVAAIKACIQQMDSGNKWNFAWKVVEVQAARHPRNSYEALYAPPGAAWTNTYGYPVHVVYSLNGRADIDAIYWLIRDVRGRWQIPAICTMP